MCKPLVCNNKWTQIQVTIRPLRSFYFSPPSPTLLYPDKFKEPQKNNPLPSPKRKRVADSSDEEEEEEEEEEMSEDEAPSRKR